MLYVRGKHRARGRRLRRLAWRRWRPLVTVAVVSVIAGAVVWAASVGAGGREGNLPAPTSDDRGSVAAGAGSPRQQQAPHSRRDGSRNPYRAFEANSWWNAPVPAQAPLDPHGAAVLHYLRTAPQSGDGCVNLAGTAGSPWGQPIYWATPTDPAYDVQGVVPRYRPPELDNLRIPVDARSASNSDGTMTIFDRAAGYVTALTDARYDAQADRWTASGATVTYLDSNGLNVLTGRSDNPHNMGSHRGNNGATMAVRWDMVKAGRIDTVLKVAVGPELANRWVFPMVGSDGGYNGDDPAVPPEGLRLRVKPTVNLARLHLAPQALVIARAMQRYGIYLGDSGSTTALKLEDTVREGLGEKWDLKPTDLCSLPFTPAYWQVLQEGYDPSRGK
jgi:hypothetical protein